MHLSGFLSLLKGGDSNLAVMKGLLNNCFVPFADGVGRFPESLERCPDKCSVNLRGLDK